MCQHPLSVNINENDPNAVLEHQVQRLVVKQQDGKETDPVLKLASSPKLYDGVVRAGTPIYVARSRFPVTIFSAAAVSLICWSILETNILAFICCVFCALIAYDLLSGFLHIVFDNPANLHIPILGQPCLEFQMHHYFPTDLVQRSFLDVLGDLNTVVSALAVWTFLVADMSNPIVRYMAGLKVFTAYYGQFSHRSAHTPSTVNSPVIETLRTLGLMIPLEKHRSHHRAPHDMDFCLVGICNPLINFLYHKVTKNRVFWMIGFFAIGLGSIPMEATIMEKLLGSAGVI